MGDIVEFFRTQEAREAVESANSFFREFCSHTMEQGVGTLIFYSKECGVDAIGYKEGDDMNQLCITGCEDGDEALEAMLEIAVAGVSYVNDGNEYTMSLIEDEEGVSLVVKPKLSS